MPGAGRGDCAGAQGCLHQTLVPGRGQGCAQQPSQAWQWVVALMDGQSDRAVPSVLSLIGMAVYGTDRQTDRAVLNISLWIGMAA